MCVSYWMYSWFCGVPGSKTWFLPQTQKSPNLPELFSMGRGRATSKHHEAKTKKKSLWGSLKTNIGRAEILTETMVFILTCGDFLYESWSTGFLEPIVMIANSIVLKNTTAQLIHHVSDILIRRAWEFVAGAKIGVVLTCATATPDINWHQALFSVTMSLWLGSTAHPGCQSQMKVWFSLGFSTI